LLVGLPLTALVVTLLGHFVAGLSWKGAALVGAVLSPTDPVFAAAIIGARKVPLRLRELLNVESGLNDGLALPLVIALLAINGAGTASLAAALGEAALGIAIGVGVSWTAVRLVRTPVFDVADAFAPIGVLAIALIVFSTSKLLGANEFLAAFSAGVTRQPLSEVLKLAAVLVFGAMVTPDLLASMGRAEYAFVILTLLLARPAAMGIALMRSELTRRERLVAAWFGPKGFASVFFAFLVIHAGVPDAERLFQLLAVVIAASIVAHSSTDVLVARLFQT
jgi:NhaP-type Na+/H+ or K+/H+ antiporter